jgi:hypothetical protein
MKIRARSKMVAILLLPMLLCGAANDSQEGGSLGCITALILVSALALFYDWAFGRNRIIGGLSRLWRKIDPSARPVEPLPPVPEYRLSRRERSVPEKTAPAQPTVSFALRAREWLLAMLRFLGIALLACLGILAVVGLVCWFAGWRSFDSYGNALVYTGVGVIFIGFYGLQGGWRGERSYAYTQARSVGHEEYGARGRHVQQSTMESYAFSIQMGIIGALTIVAGIVIHSSAP